MKVRVSVKIQLKDGMLDPQGETLGQALTALGYDGVERVRIGKWITFDVTGEDDDETRSRVDEMCRRLLANPVVEHYTFDLEEVELP